MPGNKITFYWLSIGVWSILNNASNLFRDGGDDDHTFAANMESGRCLVLLELPYFPDTRVFCMSRFVFKSARPHIYAHTISSVTLLSNPHSSVITLGIY